MTFKLNNVHKAVNWNVEDDDFTQAFWDQNVKQFWLPEEISVSKDVKVWSELSPEERNLYKKDISAFSALKNILRGFFDERLEKTDVK